LVCASWIANSVPVLREIRPARYGSTCEYGMSSRVLARTMTHSMGAADSRSELAVRSGLIACLIQAREE
jgi:hypothetical protein